MSLSRVIALFLSLLVHTIVLVGFRMPQSETKISPVVIDFQPSPNIAIEKHSPKNQNIPNHSDPEPDRSMKNPSEYLAEENTPTPTPTPFESPTQTLFPTFEPAAIPTLEITPTPTMPPVPITDPEIATVIEPTQIDSPPVEDVQKPLKNLLQPDSSIFKPLSFSKDDPVVIANSKGENRLEFSDALPEESSTSTLHSRDELAVNDYRQEILNKLQSSRRYPGQAQRRRMEGNVVVVFSIQEDGSLEDVSIEQSSGYEILDQATQNLVRKAFPMPPPPTKTEEFRITMHYSLDN